MACPHCGSWAVRSDRALAGRMVCGRCGQPLGRSGGSPGEGRRGFGVNVKLAGPQQALLILVGLLLISAVLAGLDPRSPREQRPPTRSDIAPWSL